MPAFKTAVTTSRMLGKVDHRLGNVIARLGDDELPEFIDMQVKIAAENLGMDEVEAREVAETTLPELKRWRKE